MIQLASPTHSEQKTCASQVTSWCQEFLEVLSFTLVCCTTYWYTTAAVVAVVFKLEICIVA